MKKVRTCNGCKALEGSGCILGHKIINKSIPATTFYGVSIRDIKPESGECDKPKTNSEMVKLFLKEENEQR